MSANPILPAVHFDDPELVRAIDARRWRDGERNTRRGKSPIQGFGSFATRRIPRGAPVQVGMPAHGHFPVNHSERPNVARARNRAGLFALRCIEPGEEITEDYRFLPYFGQAIPVLPQPLWPASLEEYARLLGRHRFAVRRDGASGLVATEAVLGGRAADPLLKHL